MDIAGDTRVRGDPMWLSRAIGNLVDNAFVHSEASGAIEVSVRGDAAEVQASVRSTGSIERHVRGKLFRRFITTRPDKGGSGLGLAIVRAVAEAHRGSAELVSAGPPDVEFRFSIPTARIASSLASEGAPPSLAPGVEPKIVPRRA